MSENCVFRLQPLWTIFLDIFRKCFRHSLFLGCPTICPLQPQIMCFPRYKAYPDSAEKAKSDQNKLVECVRPHVCPTPYAQRQNHVRDGLGEGDEDRKVHFSESGSSLTMTLTSSLSKAFSAISSHPLPEPIGSCRRPSMPLGNGCPSAMSLRLTYYTVSARLKGPGEKVLPGSAQECLHLRKEDTWN